MPAIGNDRLLRHGLIIPLAEVTDLILEVHPEIYTGMGSHHGMDTDITIPLDEGIQDPGHGQDPDLDIRGMEEMYTPPERQ